MMGAAEFFPRKILPRRSLTGCREIGIRMALGACKRDVVKAVMQQGMLLIGIGVAFSPQCV
jgi:hypothetical protein